MAAPVRQRVTDPGGPVLALCLGRRCSALRELSGTSGTVEALREAVARTRGAVLVTAGCLGPCALAAVGAVAHRDGESGCSGRTVWLAGVHEGERADALAGWIGAGGPAPDEDPDAGLPVPLVPAVAGLGPPMRLGG
ncbi:hypothetical protein [Geodermatophilus nigrescens]|uniref:(2Fe-2S) ferredoxin n=1 Tax=Geodermatophilus nigrescens TaxID=1070870 RepID=A0A1M5FJ42_9ACTN|nr:hypothetical protein [Geodermatophilus nigrescens]SHF91439.1 hypothetical protein SAMN05444351_1261 [Geodermatophilus nigrescens]